MELALDFYILSDHKRGLSDLYPGYVLAPDQPCVAATLVWPLKRVRRRSGARGRGRGGNGGRRGRGRGRGRDGAVGDGAVGAIAHGHDGSETEHCSGESAPEVDHDPVAEPPPVYPEHESELLMHATEDAAPVGGVAADVLIENEGEKDPEDAEPHDGFVMLESVIADESAASHVISPAIAEPAAASFEADDRPAQIPHDPIPRVSLDDMPGNITYEISGHRGCRIVWNKKNRVFEARCGTNCSNSDDLPTNCRITRKTTKRSNMFQPPGHGRPLGFMMAWIIYGCEANKGMGPACHGSWKPSWRQRIECRDILHQSEQGRQLLTAERWKDEGEVSEQEDCV